ncbi:MAG TPA: SDR family oxidoreductase [Candidatus Tumulicola sp.]|jgi:NAD(P)-dependent dehydrogenase (short-subunit alcohol dehydrogenase family)
MTDKKVVVITGASHGIGAGLVDAYRSAGFRVVANALDIGPSTDPDVLNVAGDITDPATADRIMSEGVDKFGRVDTLINNAGAYISKPFTQYTQADCNVMLSTSLAGFFYITQRVLSRMEAQGSGHVVTITATAAEQPVKGVPAVLVSMVKGGLNSATKSLAIEYASRGIRVNAVSPIIIRTHPEAAYDGLEWQIPLGRIGEIGDVTAAVMYLENASYVTGEISHVDGGQSAGHW